jgi:hypothetical protein
MNRISERDSLTQEEKFVPLVHLYAELQLPFDAALDAAEADFLAELRSRVRVLLLPPARLLSPRHLSRVLLWHRLLPSPSSPPLLA